MCINKHKLKRLTLIFKDFDMNYHKFSIILTKLFPTKPPHSKVGPVLIIYENLNKIVMHK